MGVPDLKSVLSARVVQTPKSVSYQRSCNNCVQKKYGRCFPSLLDYAWCISRRPRTRQRWMIPWYCITSSHASAHVPGACWRKCANSIIVSAMSREATRCSPGGVPPSCARVILVFDEANGNRNDVKVQERP